jgi:hypothetical protein
MAEFCQKCADANGFPEAELTIKGLKMEKDTYRSVLCEGCTMIFIANVRGKEVVFRPDKPTIF